MLEQIAGDHLGLNEFSVPQRQMVRIDAVGLEPFVGDVVGVPVHSSIYLNQRNSNAKVVLCAFG